jgi:hypothetical protein
MCLCNDVYGGGGGGGDCDDDDDDKLTQRCHAIINSNL